MVLRDDLIALLIGHHYVVGLQELVRGLVAQDRREHGAQGVAFESTIDELHLVDRCELLDDRLYVVLGDR